MNCLGIALSTACLYFISRGLHSSHDKNNTIVALYFLVLLLLGMMVGDAYIEIKRGPIDTDLLVPGRPDPLPIVLGALIGLILASVSYPLIRRKNEHKTT